MKPKSLADILPKEEDPIMSDMTSADYENMQSKVTPDMLYSIPKLSDILPIKSEQVNTPIVAESDIQQTKVPSIAETNTQQTSPKAPQAPDTRTDYEKLEDKLQELRGLDAARQETASKYNFGAKAAAILGDAISKYQSGAIQKNVGVPIQHTGPSLQQLMGIIGEVKAPSTAEQKQALMDQYKQLALNQRAQARLTSEEERAKAADLRARELAQMQIEGNLKAAGIKAGGKSATGFTPYQEKQIKREDEKDLQKLSTSITKLGLPTITSAINSIENQLGMTLEEALQRNTDDDKTNDVEVPGYGRVGSLAPDIFVGDKSRAFRQDVGSLLNPQISKQFGASQTKGEIERFQKEVGSGTFESEAAILRGLSNIKRSANADLKATYAGYRPELVDTYRTREGVTLQESPELDPRVELFMKQNKITDRDEAIKILKDNKIIK